MKLQMIHANHTNHRKKHNDDYYRDNRRKKINIFKISQKQIVVNYEFVIIYINNCENQFDAIFHELFIDLNKIR